MGGASTLGLPASLPSEDILANYRDMEVGAPSGSPASDSSTPTVGFEPFVRHVQKEIVRSEPHFMLQRERWKDDWKFNDGHQLSDEDLRILKARKAPDTAINELQKFIKFASGIERRTRQALQYGARTMEDEQATLKGEAIGKYYDWYCAQAQADDERSRTFEAKLVAGLAIMDYGISRITDPAGRPRANFCDVSEFLFPKCDKTNWGLDTDSPIKWIGREKWTPVEECVRKWPDSEWVLRAAAGGTSEDQFPSFGKGAGNPINYVVPWIMTEPLNVGGKGNPGKPGMCQILEWQEYFDEDGYYFYDPIEKDDTWLNTSDFRRLRNVYRSTYRQEITDYDRMDHRVFKRAFMLERKILLQEPKPLPTRDAGFTWNVMTGAWDRHDEVWFGFLRLFKAPQRYANAMFRQVLEILGSSHKNGAFVEVNAMTTAQKRDYEQEGSSPGNITMVQPGAISGQRILPKSVPTLPQGTMEVLAFCIDIMEKISGISMSLLGNDQSNTPGVSLRRRLTSGMVLLAAEFDGLTRFRKREGGLVFEFMRLIADDRIVRIVGPFDSQALPLTKDPFGLKYDISLDELDQDPNMRQTFQDNIMTLAPLLVKLGYFIPEILDYVNIPVQFRQALKKGIERTDQQKMQMAMQGIQPGGRGKPRGIEEMKADVALKQGRTMEHMAKAQAIQAKTRQEGVKTVFDIQHRNREAAQHDRSLTIEMLGKIFDALKDDKRAQE